ncbi:MAG: terminase [Actinomycetota bacterium]|nr:terminase [Actinomycetota bacterium]
MTLPAAPRGTRAAGRRLWRAVLTDYELAEHELTLLRQAVHVADLCEQLQHRVDIDGPLLGDRAHPALVELRQQRVLLARLIVALRVPLEEDEEQHSRSAPRSQRRGLRGVYGIRGGAA